MTLVRIGSVSDLPARKSMQVRVNGMAIALFNVDGTFFAISDTCTHRGGPLHEGDLDGKVVTCPLHGAQFDVTTGQNLSPPAPTKVASFKVVREGNDLFLDL